MGMWTACSHPQLALSLVMSGVPGKGNKMVGGSEIIQAFVGHVLSSDLNQSGPSYLSRGVLFVCVFFWGVDVETSNI